MSYIKELQKGNETLSCKNKMLEEKILILKKKIQDQMVKINIVEQQRDEYCNEVGLLKEKLNNNPLDILMNMGIYAGSGRSRLFEMEEN